MIADAEELLEEAGLIYVTDSQPGISRVLNGKGFLYRDHRGKAVEDEKTLLRIKKLAIPPAWENVWIALKGNAHLQATGTDKAGRKQYRYHSEWCRARNDTKYFRLLEFGNSLACFRANLRKDLRRRSLDERKVLAISVSMMQKTLIRIGNESYKQLYGSYGLTTLRDKHVKINGGQLHLSFRGKKGIDHEIRLTDRNLARLVKNCRDIPGQELFQYYTDDGNRRSIDSGKINRYIREITDCDFTAKDFRTWAGTLEMLRALARCPLEQNITRRKKSINECLDEVAAKLGNTRAVCRKAYVFPALLDAYETGGLLPFIKKLKKDTLPATGTGLTHDEKVLLGFLRKAESGRLRSEGGGRRTED